MSEWIKCSERMPDVAIAVLVYDQNEREYSVAAWGRDGWGQCAGVDGYEWEFILTPTHWMPLPEPPDSAEAAVVRSTKTKAKPRN